MEDANKRVTRSQSLSDPSSSSLLGFGLGEYLFGADHRRHIRAVSPATSPALSVTTEEQRFFPANEETIAITTTTTTNDMGDQALASLTSALSGLQVSSRKPDLPAFDKSAIEIWIKRVESAFIRSGITRAVEKFAFIESKFAVNEDPSIDKFLFGTASDETWNAFCAYLKKRYGKTTRQKVTSLLEPAQMDGRTPLQFLARLQQNTDGISLDDVYKEICMRQLPNDIQHVICKATEGMSATELMQYAESFYNPDGSRLLKKPAPINAMENATAAPPTPFTSVFNDNNSDEASGGDVNAIRGRQGFQQKRPFNNGSNNNNNFSRSKSRGRSFGNGGNGGASGGGNNNSSRQNSKPPPDPSLCFYHNMFGDRAKKCDIGCAKSKSGNGPSPRQ